MSDAQHPGAFLQDCLASDLQTVLAATINHRTSLKSPPKALPDYLDTLEKQGLEGSVARLRREFRLD
ncbi:MAG: hypothetical protein FGM40_09475 [Rhodocyclaceae bacterium]|nr:hypothetical protein [Rhodocyclaceae bacterium]